MAWPIHLSKWESGLNGEPGIWLAFSSGLDLASSRGASGLRGVDQVEWSGSNGRCALRNRADALKYARESRSSNWRRVRSTRWGGGRSRPAIVVVSILMSLPRALRGVAIGGHRLPPRTMSF